MRLNVGDTLVLRCKSDPSVAIQLLVKSELGKGNNGYTLYCVRYWQQSPALTQVHSFICEDEFDLNDCVELVVKLFKMPDEKGIKNEAFFLRKVFSEKSTLLIETSKNSLAVGMPFFCGLNIAAAVLYCPSLHTVLWAYLNAVHHLSMIQISHGDLHHENAIAVFRAKKIKIQNDAVIIAGYFEVKIYDYGQAKYIDPNSYDNTNFFQLSKDILDIDRLLKHGQSSKKIDKSVIKRAGVVISRRLSKVGERYANLLVYQ